MTPFSDLSGASGELPTSSAPHARAEESGTSPEPQTGDAESAPLPDEGGQKAEASQGAEAEELTPEEALANDAASEAPEVDLQQLTARAEKADEYLELAQRTKADFENYRRRAVREAAAAQDRGVAKLAKELLPAVDNLDRALAAAEAAGEAGAADNGTSTLVSGIKLVHADVLAALGRAGIEPFSPHGEPFDPQHHEAVAQQPVEGAQPGTVVEVYQCGYRLGEAILRPARVLVAG